LTKLIHEVSELGQIPHQIDRELRTGVHGQVDGAIAEDLVGDASPVSDQVPDLSISDFNVVPGS